MPDALLVEVYCISSQCLTSPSVVQTRRNFSKFVKQLGSLTMAAGGNIQPIATKTKEKSAVLHRHLDHEFLAIEKTAGNYLYTESGQKIFDGSGGPSVACIGWGNERVIDAMTKQLRSVPYCPTVFCTTQVAEDLGRFLVNSTKGHMSRAYLVNSGSAQVWSPPLTADS